MIKEDVIVKGGMQHVLEIKIVENKGVIKEGVKERKRDRFTEDLT